MSRQETPSASVQTLRRTTVGLGTFISIEAAIPLQIDGGTLLDQVCVGFEEVEARMHPTRQGSDLIAIANALPGDSVSIHPSTFAVLRLCMQVWRDSSGVF